MSLSRDGVLQCAFKATYISSGIIYVVFDQILSKRLLFYYFLIQSLLILKKSLVITINLLCIESSLWIYYLIEVNKNNDILLKPLFIFKVCFKASYLLLFSHKKTTYWHLSRCPLVQVAPESALVMGRSSSMSADLYS